MKRWLVKATDTDAKIALTEVGEDWQSWNKAIGANTGTIVATVDPRVELWCDDEALCKADPILNVIASMAANQPIYGDAIFFRQGDIK